MIYVFYFKIATNHYYCCLIAIIVRGLPKTRRRQFALRINHQILVGYYFIAAVAAEVQQLVAGQEDLMLQIVRNQNHYWQQEVRHFIVLAVFILHSWDQTKGQLQNQDSINHFKYCFDFLLELARCFNFDQTGHPVSCCRLQQNFHTTLYYLKINSYQISFQVILIMMVVAAAVMVIIAFPFQISYSIENRLPQAWDHRAVPISSGRQFWAYFAQQHPRQPHFCLKRL